MRYIELGGVSIPYEANIGFSQTYEDAQTRQVKYYSSGEPIRLRSNVSKKIKTVMSAPAGVFPDSFDGLDWDNVHTLKCARARTRPSDTNIVTIPAARRSDTGYEPFGFAIVNDRRVATAIDSVLVDQYTLTLVPGASSYGVGFYPQFDVIASKKSPGKYGWMIEAVEV